jgi:hypothetical protein
MRLEDLTVALRPRLSWEAADLGCTLVRRDFPRILGLWAATVLPLWIVLAIALVPGSRSSGGLGRRRRGRCRGFCRCRRRCRCWRRR